MSRSAIFACTRETLAQVISQPVFNIKPKDGDAELLDKILSDLAIMEPAAFQAVVEKAKAALPATA